MPNGLLLEIMPLVNYLLPSATPMGAYGMGLITALSVDAGISPPQDLLKRVSHAQTVAEAHTLWEGFREEQRLRLDLPATCMACGAPLYGGATVHEPGCRIKAMIDEVFSEQQPPPSDPQMSDPPHPEPPAP